MGIKRAKSAFFSELKKYVCELSTDIANVCKNQMKTENRIKMHNVRTSNTEKQRHQLLYSIPLGTRQNLIFYGT